jgi:hypothetical protein
MCYMSLIVRRPYRYVRAGIGPPCGTAIPARTPAPTGWLPWWRKRADGTIRGRIRIRGGRSTGRAAEMLGTTQGFLRAIGEARLITPLSSESGHRRHSCYQLRIAARAREPVDHVPPPGVWSRPTWRTASTCGPPNDSASHND